MLLLAAPRLLVSSGMATSILGRCGIAVSVFIGSLSASVEEVEVNMSMGQDVLLRWMPSAGVSCASDGYPYLPKDWSDGWQIKASTAGWQQRRDPTCDLRWEGGLVKERNC
jgi:hypothetical protein